MAEAVGQFSSADQPENELFTFDFVNDLAPGDSIVSVTSWDCTVAVGVDDDPAARLIGPPSLFGTQVTQRASGFLPGVQYVMACLVATALGSSLQLWAYLDGEVVGC